MEGDTQNMQQEKPAAQPKQSNNKAMLWIVLVIIIIVLGALFIFSGNSNTTPDDTALTPEDNATDTTSTTGADEATAPLSATITYTENGFEPNEVTIGVGGTVTWVNESGHDMWVASAMHPVHAAYDGTNLQEHCADGVSSSFDECGNGTEYSFTFDKAGEWAFHNHSRASDFGKVIVQ